jgi:hypothetical protein
MTRRQENAFPWVAATAAPVIYFGAWKLLSLVPSQAGIDKLVSGVLSLSGILVGFLATTNALMFAVPDRRALKLLKQLGAFSGIARHLFFDIQIWFIAAISSLVLIFTMDRLASLHNLRVIIGYWLYLPAVGLVGLWQAMSLFRKFLYATAVQDETPAPHQAAPTI